MTNYPEYAPDDSATASHAQLNLPRRIVELARIITTDCKGPGRYIIELGLSSHEGEPMTYKIQKIDTIHHGAIEKGDR